MALKQAKMSKALKVRIENVILVIVASEKILSVLISALSCCLVVQQHYHPLMLVTSES